MTEHWLFNHLLEPNKKEVSAALTRKSSRSNSYVRNIVFIPKPGDSTGNIRLHGDGSADVFLDGYAIIPLEKYEEMKTAI